MFQKYFFCALLIFSFIVSGCSGQPMDITAQSSDNGDTNPGQAGGAITELTEEQNGGIVALIVNDIVRVQIDGNPTTGFIWETENLDANLLEQIGEAEFTSKSNVPGGGGMFTFTFKALDAGVTHLRLIYHRPFEKDIPPAQIFDVTVDIQK
jgi:predicted secreted protein